jgi:hypothetical protein
LRSEIESGRNLLSMAFLVLLPGKSDVGQEQEQERVTRYTLHVTRTSALRSEIESGRNLLSMAFLVLLPGKTDVGQEQEPVTRDT